MERIFNRYQLAFNSLMMDIKNRIREIDDAEMVVGQIDEYLEIERDTLEGIIQKMEREKEDIKE